MIFKALLWIVETIYKAAEDELYNVENIQKKFIELRTMYELGEIGDEDYNTAKKILMERLEKAIERKKELDNNDGLGD